MDIFADFLAEILLELIRVVLELLYQSDWATESRQRHPVAWAVSIIGVLLIPLSLAGLSGCIKHARRASVDSTLPAAATAPTAQAPPQSP